MTGERASSHLELHNEGSTAIFYSWQQLPKPHSFPNLRSQTKNLHFYFSSSSGTHTNIIRHLLPPLLRHTLFVHVSARHIFQPVFNPPFCFPFFASPSHPGVIHPGETQRVEFVFKSEKSGIKTELWQLNTHPVLLQGASMQVTLRGVALYQDKTADQRLFLEVVLQLNCVLESETERHMDR